MLTSNNNPKWWQLYLTFPLLIVLFILDHRLQISTRVHQAVQIAIILLVYGLIHLWLKANARALSGIDQRQYYGRVMVVRIPPYQASATGNDKRPMLQLPRSEIRGTLSDTFEMDIIDADLLPVDNIPEELNKE
jgi:hypothetical protein